MNPTEQDKQTVDKKILQLIHAFIMPKPTICACGVVYCSRNESVMTIIETYLKALQEENKRLRDCVGFYADKDGDCWAACRPEDTKDTCCHMIAENSGGEKARHCLEGLKCLK